jgi:hypothetical protein
LIWVARFDGVVVELDVDVWVLLLELLPDRVEGLGE